MAALQLSEIDYLDPAILSEPYEFYEVARRESPVVRVPGRAGKRDIYLVCSYELVVAVTADTETFSSAYKALLFEGASHNPEADAILATGWPQSLSGLLLTSDDPEHKRWRSLVNAAFLSKRISEIAPEIERIIDELIDCFIARGTCDFVEEFAVRLPSYVIADVLGIERNLFAKVVEWSDAILIRLSQMATKEQEIAAAYETVEMQRFLVGMIQARRAEPQEDLISKLVTARVDGLVPLTDEEILGSVQEILVAGNETTRNTLMSGMARLLQDNAQHRAVIEDPSLFPSAIEEILRMETPASSIWRIATCDTELGGVAIPKGAAISLRFDAASRDETVFPDGETFDVRRGNARNHLAFSRGTHHCLGAALARKELNIGFPKLFQRLKNLRIIADQSDLSHRPSLLHHGIRKLSLAFDT